jgi:hypothetical protein
VGEAFAEMYGGTSDGSGLDSAKQQEVLAVSKMVAAAAAGLTGKDAATAVDAAQNAVLNNWLFVSEEQALKAAKIDCGTSGPYSHSCQRQAALEALDARRDVISKPLEAACVAGSKSNCELAQAFRIEELSNALGQGRFDTSDLTSLINASTGVVAAESQGNPMAINAQRNADGSYKKDANGNLIVNQINGKADPGGLSYGLVQFASNVGGMQDFLSFLKINSGVSVDAKSAYDTLMNAGGVQGAKDGTPAFVQAWQSLTKDPQFQIYQLEATVRNGNVANVNKYFQSLGINLTDLEGAQQEVVLAMVVQRAKATKQDVAQAFMSVSEDVKKIIDTMAANGTFLDTALLRDKLDKAANVVTDVQKQLSAAEAARANAEAAAKNAALRVIDLQAQSGDSAVPSAKQTLAQATQALEAANQNAEAANQAVLRVQQQLTIASDQAQTIREEWKAFFVDNAVSKDANGKVVLGDNLLALLAQVKKIDPGRAKTLEAVIKKLYPTAK